MIFPMQLLVIDAMYVNHMFVAEALLLFVLSVFLVEKPVLFNFYDFFPPLKMYFAV